MNMENKKFSPLWTTAFFLIDKNSNCIYHGIVAAPDEYSFKMLHHKHKTIFGSLKKGQR